MSEFERREQDSLFSVCALAQEEVFAVTNSPWNLPITINKADGEIILLKDVENYALDFDPDMMLNDGEYIYTLELSGRRLMRYSVADRKCQYYQINCHQKDWGNFAAFVKYGDWLYIFQTYLGRMLKISFGSLGVQMSCSTYPAYKKKMEHFEQKDSIEYFVCGCQLENRIWLLQRQGSLAVAYNMELDTWEEYEMLVKINDCIHAAAYGGRIYILSSEGKIYVFDPQGMYGEEIADCSNLNTYKEAFSRLVVTDKNIYLLPCLGRDIFIVDINTRKVKKYESYPDNFEYCVPKGWSKFHGYCEDEDHYYCAMRSMNFFLTIDKRSGKERWIKPQLPLKEEYRKTYVTYKKELLIEREGVVEALIDYLCNEKKDSQNKNCDFAGDQIWKRLKD